MGGTLVLVLVLALAWAPAHAKSTTAYPEVVSIFSTVAFDGKSDMAGRCSGTFIHPRLLLTAAHCVRHFNVSKMNGKAFRASDALGNPAKDLTAAPGDVYIPAKKWWGTKEIHPIRVHVSPAAIPLEHADISFDHVEQDLAILEFGSAYPHTRELADVGSPAGAPVVMVGFGKHGRMEFGTAGVGAGLPKKSEGRNILSRVERDTLVVDGSAATCDDPEPYFNDWAICGGDSGGPLIDARTGKVIGVTSAQTTFRDDERHSAIEKRKLSVYTDVNSPEARRFIADVLATISGRARR